MPKKILRREPIYIAPDIKGWIDDRNRPCVRDEKNGRDLDPYDIDDKISIYERQVKGWFLNPATRFIKGKNNGFIVLMICLSYLEGVEQYRRGESSRGRGRSREFFVSALNRIYPNSHDLNRYDQDRLEDFYRQARCGLFHNGMTESKVIYEYSFPNALNFPDNLTIEVNPKLLLQDIRSDFEDYLRALRRNGLLRRKFDRMYRII
ncbi:MAG: hypothetical protein K8T10_08305 [Candidatus Eremiobacteraeota bacterium]|nr:hypothetical protein [Candidatus Eremiobacteraeota bacterium]